jgi:hypothetical protein
MPSIASSVTVGNPDRATATGTRRTRQRAPGGPAAAVDGGRTRTPEAVKAAGRESGRSPLSIAEPQTEPLAGIKGLAKAQWNAGQHWAGKLGALWLRLCRQRAPKPWPWELPGLSPVWARSSRVTRHGGHSSRVTTSPVSST